MSSLRPYHPPSARCRAGVARRDVTPPVGIQSRSFGAALHETAEGVHRPFTATALALAGLEGDGGPMLLLAVDIGWLEKDEMAEFLDGVREPLGLDEGRLLIAFSHTHAGANLSSSMRDHPGGDKIRPYFERLIARCAEAGAEAIANLVPAWLTFGSGTCDLAQNRDAWDEDSGQFVTGFNPDGEPDDTVLVARVSADDGSVLATLVNYGCHPTTLGPTNRLLSPDYIGAMREVMEDAFGAPCLFLLSPAATPAPARDSSATPPSPTPTAAVLGSAAAAAVESLLPAGTQLEYDGPIISGATLGAWKRTKLDLPANDRSFALRTRILRIDLPIKPHESPDALKAAHDQAIRDVEAAQTSGDPIAIRNATALRERARRRLLRGPTLPTAAPSPSTSTSGRSATRSSSPYPLSLTPCSSTSCAPSSPTAQS